MTTHSMESKVAHFCDARKLVLSTQVNFGFFHLNSCGWERVLDLFLHLFVALSA